MEIVIAVLLFLASAIVATLQKSWAIALASAGFFFLYVSQVLKGFQLHPQHEPESDNLVARIWCPHGYSFLIYDACPETKEKVPELTRKEKRALRRLDKEMKKGA